MRNARCVRALAATSRPSPRSRRAGTTSQLHTSPSRASRHCRSSPERQPRSPECRARRSFLGTICESFATGAVCELPPPGEAGAPEFGHVFVAWSNLRTYRGLGVNSFRDDELAAAPRTRAPPRAAFRLLRWTITSGHAERGRLLHRPGGPRVDAPRRDAAPSARPLHQAQQQLSRRATARSGALAWRHEHRPGRRVIEAALGVGGFGASAPAQARPTCRCTARLLSLVKGQAFEHWNGRGALLLSDKPGHAGPLPPGHRNRASRRIAGLTKTPAERARSYAALPADTAPVRTLGSGEAIARLGWP